MPGRTARLPSRQAWKLFSFMYRGRDVAENVSTLRFNVVVLATCVVLFEAGDVCFRRPPTSW